VTSTAVVAADINNNNNNNNNTSLLVYMVNSTARGQVQIQHEYEIISTRTNNKKLNQ
jgi:hypothetical protein